MSTYSPKVVLFWFFLGFFGLFRSKRKKLSEAVFSKIPSIHTCTYRSCQWKEKKRHVFIQIPGDTLLLCFALFLLSSFFLLFPGLQHTLHTYMQQYLLLTYLQTYIGGPGSGLGSGLERRREDRPFVEIWLAGWLA